MSSSVHAELERYMFIARDIILANKDFLLGLAEKLEDKGIILSSDIKAVRDQVTVTSFTV